ncbi:MAG: Nitrate/nitrite binding protein NrtA [Pseudomonadota bacterium]
MKEYMGMNHSRRSLIKATTGGLILSSVTGSLSAYAQGSDAPEKKEVKIGFIPLTDSASVIMAAVKGLDKKYGVSIVLSKEASWAAIRDKLINGEIDYAHCLYGLPLAVQLGLTGEKKDMAILMGLNHNGQAITLSNQLKAQGVKDGSSLAAAIKRGGREYKFAQTYPTGTHAMWLYYWLAAHEINPMSASKIITVPPPQMIANMQVGNMDGYCVGEPWNARAVIYDIGFTVTTSQAICADHPEKVLTATDAFVRKHPNTTRAVMAAILEASRAIDANPSEAAQVIRDKAYVNTELKVIEGRMLGQYEDGLGNKWQDKSPMRFSGNGAVNMPYVSDSMWFMSQFKRWGLLKTEVDYLAVAKQVNRVDLFKEAAALAKMAVPKDEFRSLKFMDGKLWDARTTAATAAYVNAFKVKI